MNEELENDVIINVEGMPKSKDICEKFNLSAPQLKYYRDFFHIEVIEQMQGDKPILYYPPAGVHRLDEIFELKESGIKSLHVIKQKLGIKDSETSITRIDTNDNKMIKKAEINDLVKNTESLISNKFDYIIESLSDSLKFFGEEVKDNKALNEKINNLIEEVTENKTALKEKENYIKQLKSNNESEINHYKTIAESEINHLKRLNEEITSSKNEIISELNQRINYLSENLKIKDSKIDNLENEIVKKDKEIQKLKSLVAFWNKGKI